VAVAGAPLRHGRKVHSKEHQAKTFGTDYYLDVFRLRETKCGARWYLVEMGGTRGNGFELPRRALAKVHSLGK